ncbi:HAD family phosphatase [Tumebacillus sp. ITR2]|uniref:HAD family phosphatase n=1 Tax=Tumebacillus amylolyticus TaxID=2801339 RepID=A0ABS1J807_9BACL|nr:Cof-type HAD-IIB family hydrolase [Tumebacillus amylolyticus]MBL0386427.1 HAD family phosphatase [Tumebacillus amylolyticus]
MTYKMLISDIDGTLLNSKMELSQATIEAIREAYDQGIIVTLATGRQLRGVVDIVKQIGISVPVILGNGAVVVDPLEQKTLLHQTLDVETTDAILDVIAAHGLWSSVFVHTFEGVDTYYDQDPGFAEAYIFIHTHIPEVVQQVESLKDVAHLQPIKVLLIDKTEKILPLYDDLKKLPQNFNMVISDHDWPGFSLLECFHYGTTKASGIQHIAEVFNIAPEQIVAVGDNTNDWEMIEFAGLGVAMGNAHPSLKERADWITKTNDEDGVAYLIREKMLE